MASAHRATARATLASLRRQIASIENLAPAQACGGTGWSGEREAERSVLLATGLDAFDRETGGVALAALTGLFPLKQYVREHERHRPVSGFSQPNGETAMQIFTWGIIGVISAFAVGAAVRGLSPPSRPDRNDDERN